MKSIKHGIVVDYFLRTAKTPTHINKWLTAEKQEEIIKSLFDFERKEEELEGKFLNYVLGRDERLKRATGAHSNLSKSDTFCQRTFAKRKRIVLHPCIIPEETPSKLHRHNANNINASIRKTIGN